MNDLKTLLNHLPYKLAAYDAQGNFLYDNGGADGLVVVFGVVA